MTGRDGVQRAAAVLVVVAAVFTAGAAVAAEQEKTASGPKRFATPEQATEALVNALRANNFKATLAVLGAEARPLVSSGDSVQDRAKIDGFLKQYDAAHRIDTADDKAIIYVGQDDWPMPIPIVKSNGSWHFDTRAGKEEILNRRIGENELSVIQVCLAYVDAQREYFEQPRDGSGVLQYAQKIRSSPGLKDGLYWDTRPDEPPSPLGPLAARASAQGYKRRGAGAGPAPYHGYYFRILTGQGPDAPGGAYDYVVNGHMIGGFALVAFPAEYGVTGVMSFVVNHDGIVYQKNLGPKTLSVARAMKLFNPDKTWTKVEAPALSAQAR